MPCKASLYIKYITPRLEVKKNILSPYRCLTNKRRTGLTKAKRFAQRDLMNFDLNPCTVHIYSNVLASFDTLIEEPGSMPLGLVVGSGTATVELENPEPGRVEIDPDSLWEKVTKVCTPYLMDSNQIL